MILIITDNLLVQDVCLLHAKIAGGGVKRGFIIICNKLLCMRCCIIQSIILIVDVI